MISSRISSQSTSSSPLILRKEHSLVPIFSVEYQSTEYARHPVTQIVAHLAGTSVRVLIDIILRCSRNVVPYFFSTYLSIHHLSKRKQSPAQKIQNSIITFIVASSMGNLSSNLFTRYNPISTFEIISIFLYGWCSFLYLVDYIVSYSYCKLTIIFSIPNSTCQSSILFLVSIYILHSSS